MPCSMALRMFFRPRSAAESDWAACLRLAATSAPSELSATMRAIRKASSRSCRSARSALTISPSSSSRLTGLTQPSWQR